MAVAYVGAGSTNLAKGTVNSLTVSTGAVSSGDTVILRYGARATGTGAIPTLTITDTGSNAWSQIGTTSSVASLGVAYLCAATMGAAGTFTVTVNQSVGSNASVVATDIFSGVTLTADGSNTGGSTGTTTAVSVTSFSTASAGDLVVACVSTVNIATTLSSPPAGWNVFSGVPATAGAGASSNISLEGAYLIQGAAGSVAFSATQSTASQYSSTAAALTAGAGAPAGPVAGPPLIVATQAVTRASTY